MMRPNTFFDNKIMFRVDPDLVAAIEQASKQENLNTSEYLRYVLRQHLNVPAPRRP